MSTDHPDQDLVLDADRFLQGHQAKPSLPLAEPIVTADIPVKMSADECARIVQAAIQEITKLLSERQAAQGIIDRKHQQLIMDHGAAFLDGEPVYSRDPHDLDGHAKKLEELYRANHEETHARKVEIYSTLYGLQNKEMPTITDTTGNKIDGEISPHYSEVFSDWANSIRESVYFFDRRPVYIPARAYKIHPRYLSFVSVGPIFVGTPGKSDSFVLELISKLMRIYAQFHERPVNSDQKVIYRKMSEDISHKCSDHDSRHRRNPVISHLQLMIPQLREIKSHQITIDRLNQLIEAHREVMKKFLGIDLAV